jgi:HSP20 family molecular chaperone IbpA
MSTFAPVRHEMGPFFNLFNDTFNELQKISENTTRSFAPRFDVKEAKDSYILEGELPGIDQKDISIEFADEQTLTIKGRTEHFKEEGQRPTEAEDVSNESGEHSTSNGSGNQQKTSSSKEVANKGSTEVAKHEPQHTYWVSERSVGEFARSFAFPHRVDQENVKASLKNGILSVVVPKLSKPATSKKITIE